MDDKFEINSELDKMSKIAAVMEFIDFENIKIAMDALNWKWYLESTYSIPDVEQIKKYALMQLDRCWNEFKMLLDDEESITELIVSSGGFYSHAFIDKTEGTNEIYISLSFRVEDSSIILY